MSLFLLITGLVLFIALVVVHEFGHYIAARKNGIDVEEFGIGFPPRAKVLGVRKGTVFSLNWLPLGGFVRLKGEYDASKVEGGYGAAPLRAKALVMVAGVAMNLLAAFVLFALLALVGMPKLFDGQFTVARDTKIVRQQVLVGYVEPGSPAAKAGLQARDRLVVIGEADKPETGRPITSQDQLPHITKEFAGKRVSISAERDGKSVGGTVTLRSAAEVEASKKTNQPKGYLGVSPTEYTLQRSTWSAPIVSLGIMKQLTVMTFTELGKMFANLAHGKGQAASQGVAGPVGIFMVVKDGSFLGYQFVLVVIAVISMSLAIMNILPIPALDGGRLFVTLLFRAMRKPLTKHREELIHGTGFVALILLLVFITFLDIKRF